MAFGAHHLQPVHSTANIAYHSIEGGAEAIRAESCDECHTYRKILYQEKDTKRRASGGRSGEPGRSIC